MNRISLSIFFSLGALLAVGTAAESLAAPLLASSDTSTTPYYGYYRCVESMEGAGLLILKIDTKGISFIELRNAFDDPSKGKIDDTIFKISSVKQSDVFTRIQGTSESTQTTVWKTTDSSTLPEIKKTVSTVQFTLDWQQGKDAKPDSVILTLLNETGNSHAMHFERTP